MIAWVLLASSLAAAPTSSDVEKIGPDGWPENHRVPDLRALRECKRGEELPRTAGSTLPCRPPLEPGWPQWGFGLDWTSGATFGDVPTAGGAEGAGLELDWAVLRNVQFAARDELLAAEVPGDVAVSNHLLGLMRLRWFSDEVERNGWTFGVGGGYAFRGYLLGGSAPMIRISVGRENGILDHTTATTGKVELAYEQSFGTASLSMILLSVRLGYEANIRAPENLGQPAPSPWRHTTSFDLMISPWFGAGMSFGLRAGEHFSLESSATYLAGFTGNDQTVHPLEGASWSLATGPRYQAPWPDFAPFYFQLQGGGAWVSVDPKPELHAILAAEVGFRALIGCKDGADLGFWLRGNLDNATVTAGGLALRFVIGAGAGAAGGQGRVCEGPDLRLGPIPSGPPDHRESGQTVTLTPNLELGGQVQLGGPIEIDLGVPSGRLELSGLPLPSLRAATQVSVEIIGPREQLASFRARLAEELSREGVRVETWTLTPSSASRVRARFTVLPPPERVQ